MNRRLALTGATALALFLSTQSLAQDTSSPTYGSPITHTTETGTTTLTPSTDGFDIAFQDLRGVTTRYTYGPTGQLVSETIPGVGPTRYRYDATGRVDRRITADGLTTVIAYDDQGRIIRQAMRDKGQDRIVTRYEHDTCENGDQRLCRVVHNDHVTRYAYTPDGKLAKVTTRLADETTPETLRYHYLDKGQLDRMRYTSGLVVKYHYDPQDALTRLTGHYETGEDRRHFVLARNITFDDRGRLTGFTHGNGVRTRLRRTDKGVLTRITLAKDGTILDRSDLSRDQDGRVTAIDRPDDRQDRQFAYDAQGRLITETTGDGTPDATRRIDYTLDAANNRTTRTEDGRTRRYRYAADSNRLTQVGGDGLSYDGRGNLISDRSDRRSFVYDATNRMVEYHQDGTLRATYDYDAQGRRIRKRLMRPDADGVRSIRFVYDTDGRLVSETSRRDNRAALQARDLVWLGGLPLAQVERRVLPNGTTRKANVLSLHADHLGAPREARDESGTVTWRWTRDAFGAGVNGRRNAGVERDPDGDGVKTEVSLRFPGQYHDRESGLFYNHHRDYDPLLGRYIQSDPIGLGGGVNRYAYVGGDPVNNVDPEGLKISDCKPLPGNRGIGCRFSTIDRSCETRGTCFGGGGEILNYGDPNYEQYAQLGPTVPIPPFVQIAKLREMIDEKLCQISKNVAFGSDLATSLFETRIESALESLGSELSRDINGRITIGYSVDVSVIAAYIGGVHGSIGVWGDNGNYGYSIALGPSAGIGASTSAGVSGSPNYNDDSFGIRVAAGAAGVFGGEIGSGTQFSNAEINVGLGTPTSYATLQGVLIKTCND